MDLAVLLKSAAWENIWSGRMPSSTPVWLLSSRIRLRSERGSAALKAVGSLAFWTVKLRVKPAALFSVGKVELTSVPVRA